MGVCVCCGPLVQEQHKLAGLFKEPPQPSLPPVATDAPFGSNSSSPSGSSAATATDGAAAAEDAAAGSSAAPAPAAAAAAAASGGFSFGFKV